MHFSFRIDAPGLDKTAFLIARDTLDASGDLETAFFDQAGPITQHRGNPLGQLAASLTADPDIEVLAVLRNPALVLDPGLPGRIAAAINTLAPLSGRWSLAAAGGLAPNGSRACALYSTSTPFLPSDAMPRPLIDPLPDLYLVAADWLRDRAFHNRVLPDSGLETILVNQGYLDGRVAVYAPALTGGVNGPLLARDPVRLRLDLQDWFESTLAGEEIPTLMGPVAIQPPPSQRPDPRIQSTCHILAEAIERTVEAHCSPLSLSIVTRTRFARPHLLERLLTSITRARCDDCQIEVILSSDCPLAACKAALADLRAKFVNLTLRLQHNPPKRHSRITNLISGLKAATGTHVVVMDDDDYVDLFAFSEMQRALFLGACPLIVTGSVAHDEQWEETPSGRHILASSTERLTYPSIGWREMFSGINRLPVCALVIPRKRLTARLKAFDFDHDLSEDYTLFLLLMTDPHLPEVVELPGVFGHISLRATENHSITMEDRRPWARDIALYLADLTRNPAVAGPGQWALLAGSTDPARALDSKAIAELQSALTNRDQQLRLLRSEIARLRASSSSLLAEAQQASLQPLKRENAA